MYAIYGNIYHQYTPVMLAYIPYMDPMGLKSGKFITMERSTIFSGKTDYFYDHVLPEGKYGELIHLLLKMVIYSGISH